MRFSAWFLIVAQLPCKGFPIRVAFTPDGMTFTTADVAESAGGS